MIRINKNTVVLAISLLAAGLPLSFGRPVAALSKAAAATPTPNATNTAAPIPANIPFGTPVPVTTPTLLDLQNAIRQRTFDPAARRGRVGIKIVSQTSGKVIFEQDSDKYFVPASNMKNFTIATAFERLGPNFKFVTSVYAAAPVDSNGAVTGDLRVMD